MDADYVPHVTSEDVLRVIRRDFPWRDPKAVLRVLHQYDIGRESDRVHLAILKLSNRNMDQLHDYVEIANRDFRDVIAPAEYPGLWAVGLTGVARMTPAEVKQLKEDDWRQYQSWLYGEER